MSNETEVQVREAENGLESVFPKTRLQTLQLAVGTLTVTCQAELDQANDVLRSIAQAARNVEDYWKPKEDAAHKLWKMLKDAARPWRELFSGDKEFKLHPRNLRGQVEQTIIAYQDEDRRRREAEESRLRVLAEADRKRKEQEAHAAWLRGQTAKAVELRHEAAVIVAPVLPEPPKAKGISTPVVWHAEVTNLELLVAAWQIGDVPAEAVQANLLFLNRMAARQQGQMDYPGVKAVSETGMRVRV